MATKNPKESFLLSRGWNILFKYLLRYKKDVIFLSIIGIVSAFTNAFVPYLIGNFFDALVSPREVNIGDYILQMWFVILMVWLMVQIFATITDRLNDIRSRIIGLRIRAEYASHASSYLLSLPVSFHKNHKHGETWDRITRAGGSMANIIEQVVISITPQLLSVGIGIVISYFINPILASILVTGVIVYIITLAKVVPPIVTLQRAGQKAWNDAHGIAFDAIANFQTVKQSTAEDFERKRIDRKYNFVVNLWKKVENIWANINFFQGATIVATQLAIFITSAIFITKGNLTIGELIALNGYALIVFGPFVRLAYNWQLIQNGIISIERGDEILNIPSELSKNEKNRIKGIIKGNVEFSNVSFSYGKKENELLHVYLGRVSSLPNIFINKDEAEDCKWMDINTLRNTITSRPELFTYWLQISIEKVSKCLKNLK